MNLSSLNNIRQLIKQGENEAALSMCEEVLASGASDHEIIREKVSILLKLHRTHEATSTLESLVINSGEPADYFDLARIYIREDNYGPAVAVIGELLAVSEREHFDYYASSARFLRAFALIEMGLKSEAAKDIQCLDNEMRLWVPGKGLVTVQQLRRPLGL